MYGNFDPTDKKNNVLYAAIGSGDAARILKALQDGGDMDADDGKPLILCAEKDDYKSAKILFLKGADIELALKSAQDELHKIPKTHVIAGVYLPAHEKDQPRYYALSDITFRLQKYKASFLETILPQEQARKLDRILENQQRFSAKLEAFQKELETLTKPQDLGKSLPNSFPAKEHKP